MITNRSFEGQFLSKTCQSTRTKLWNDLNVERKILRSLGDFERAMPEEDQEDRDIWVIWKP